MTCSYLYYLSLEHESALINNDLEERARKVLYIVYFKRDN